MNKKGDCKVNKKGDSRVNKKGDRRVNKGDSKVDKRGDSNDRGVRFLTTGNEIIVLCWHEAKGSTSPSAIKECEEQALDACKRSLESHSWQRYVYALTTAKTTAKAWVYERGDEELTALFEEEYIEANSNEGYKISKSFQRMKTLVTPLT